MFNIIFPCKKMLQTMRLDVPRISKKHSKYHIAVSLVIFPCKSTYGALALVVLTSFVLGLIGLWTGLITTGFFGAVTGCLKIFVHIYLKHRKPLLQRRFNHTYILLQEWIDNNGIEETGTSLTI